jgi:hypothetical protein
VNGQSTSRTLPTEWEKPLGVKFCASCGYELTGLPNEAECPECASDYTIYSVRRTPPTRMNLWREWAARQWTRPPIISPIVALLTLIVFAPMTCSPVGVHDYMYVLWVLLGGPLWVLVVIIKLLALRVNSLADCADRRWLDRVRWFSAPVLYGLVVLLIVTGWGWDIRWAIHRSSMTTTAVSLLEAGTEYQFFSKQGELDGAWFILKNGEPAWLSHEYNGYGFGDKEYVFMVYSPDGYPPSLHAEVVTLGPYPTSQSPRIDPEKVKKVGGGWWKVEAW